MTFEVLAAGSLVLNLVLVIIMVKLHGAADKLEAQNRMLTFADAMRVMQIDELKPGLQTAPIGDRLLDLREQISEAAQEHVELECYWHSENDGMMLRVWVHQHPPDGPLVRLDCERDLLFKPSAEIVATVTDHIERARAARMAL